MEKPWKLDFQGILPVYTYKKQYLSRNKLARQSEPRTKNIKQ